MSIRLIGAGFGRTGTTSLKAALEELGFRDCYHMQECFRKPSHTPVWTDAVAGRMPDWDVVFDGYQATVDWPGCTHYRELMEFYPDAKVLLSVRDAGRWYESTRTTIWRVPRSLLFRILPPIPMVKNLYRMIDATVWDGAFDGRFEERELAIEVFDRHNEAVKAHVPADRLLVYEVKEGWEPLCDFLGVPVPDGKPFPHLNDADQIKRLLRFGPWVVFSVYGGILAAILALIRG